MRLDKLFSRFSPASSQANPKALVVYILTLRYCRDYFRAAKSKTVQVRSFSRRKSAIGVARFQPQSCAATPVRHPRRTPSIAGRNDDDDAVSMADTFAGTAARLNAQWKNPSDIFTILMIIGGDIVKVALAQLCAGPVPYLTPVSFSFGWV
nr:hypothetical protein CFP56_00307 [Quercus suber]